MKKFLCCLLFIALVACAALSSVSASDSGEDANISELPTLDASALDIKAESALLMEASTGTVLYAKNENKKAPPASVTKIMTLLLVCEALESEAVSLDTVTTVSSNAASMGGSQVFLEEGERMTVEELLKCTVIASANDAAVALAELVSGSEDAFVARMNERARELGLENTSFENTTGLDDTTVNHYTSAYDIAKMSRELIKHEIILKYSSLWQDTIRDGEFTLTNTNRLVRYYEGCNGLKTGSTDKAGYCISATAKRGNMQLIAVVMGAETRDLRNAAARAMLDAGFSGYSLCEFPSEYLEEVPVIGGRVSTAPIYSGGFSILVESTKKGKIEEKFSIPEALTAPLTKGAKVGKITYILDGEVIGECDITVGCDVPSIKYSELIICILKRVISGK